MMMRKLGRNKRNRYRSLGYLQRDINIFKERKINLVCTESGKFLKEIWKKLKSNLMKLCNTLETVLRW